MNQDISINFKQISGFLLEWEQTSIERRAEYKHATKAYAPEMIHKRKLT